MDYIIISQHLFWWEKVLKWLWIFCYYMKILFLAFAVKLLTESGLSRSNSSTCMTMQESAPMLGWQRILLLISLVLSELILSHLVLISHLTLKLGTSPNAMLEWASLNQTLLLHWLCECFLGCSRGRPRFYFLCLYFHVLF